MVVVVASLFGTACDDAVLQRQTAEPGVVFAFPVDGARDVPLGARIVVTFSAPVEAGQLAAATLVGPDGPVDIAATLSEDRTSVVFSRAPLEPGTTYRVQVGAALAPFATNLPADGTVSAFTTRSIQPRAAPPTVIALDGDDPAARVRPVLESSTLRLVFSEPLDPRSVRAVAGAVELVDAAGVAVPVSVLHSGIHVVVDPVADLTAGMRYELRLGGQLVDLSGDPLAPVAFAIEPRDSRGRTGGSRMPLRTRDVGDAGPDHSRAGAPANQIVVDKPLIGREVTAFTPVTLAAELGDPQALGGPIAFTIRRGARLAAGGFDVKLGGEIPLGLSTGNLRIELLTDGGGRLYRNPFQDPAQRPENDRAPLYVDFTLDVAVYAEDAQGTAVLTQTVLGVQASGTAVATEGVLAIEALGAMDLGLLGVTVAPTNLVLELVTDEAATVPSDRAPPSLIAAFPAEGARDHAVDAGIELVFDEPVDLERLRAGGLRLDGPGGEVDAVIESHGAAVVVRPRAPLAYGASYQLVLDDVADVAGNGLAASTSLAFATERLAGTGVPVTVAAVSPGAPCVLTGATAASPGRCAGGQGSDALYRPFAVERDQRIEVAFSQPIARGSVVRGAACGSGAVRIEELTAAGTCAGVVAGTLLVRERGFAFVPDVPWAVGTSYRLTLISGNNDDCDAGELCGRNGVAASFDPLNGIDDDGPGGAPLVVTMVGAPSSGTTPLFADTSPLADLNGSGGLDGGEQVTLTNRAAMRIVDTTDSISSAKFEMPDCLPQTPEVEGCMYISGAMPVAMGELTHDCPLPDGSVAPSCLTATLSPQAMYATNVSMEATIVIGIGADTGTTVLRIKEPAGQPVTGYVIDRGGVPTLVVALSLYMDAPDMSLPLSDHDLHSKPLDLQLEGPLTFTPDGRIEISLENLADVPVTVAIDAPIGIGGDVKMIVPAREMRLQLVSRPVRAVAR